MEIRDRIEINEGTSVLAYSEYLNSLNGVDGIGYFVDGDLWMPFVVKKRGFLKWIQLYSPVFGSSSVEGERDFLNKCVKFAKEHLEISHIESTNTAVFKCYPDDSTFCKWGSYVVDLSKTEEELFKAIHSKHRNVIRKAESNGLIVQQGKEYAKAVVSLMNETTARQGGSYAYDDNYIHRLNKLGENVDWWIVKDRENQIHGSAVFLWSKNAPCYYLHGGSSAHTSPGAMNFLIWKAMITMKKRGCTVFDFVGARLTTEPGSKLEGIQRFKSRFGSEMKVGYMFRVICNPLKYYIHEWIFFFYKLIKHINTNDAITEERAKGNC